MTLPISTYQQTNETQPQGKTGSPQGQNRVSEIKKVLPDRGGLCTVVYPAPPAYFTKFETGVPFIHKNRCNTHG